MQISDWIGLVFCIIFVAMIVFTIAMMWPIYEKFSWDQYQLIGLDRSLQKSFRYIQLAKAAFLGFFCMSMVQLFVMVYFEKSWIRSTIVGLFSLYLLIEIRLGYNAVIFLLSSYLTKTNCDSKCFLALQSLILYCSEWLYFWEHSKSSITTVLATCQSISSGYTVASFDSSLDSFRQHGPLVLLFEKVDATIWLGSDSAERHHPREETTGSRRPPRRPLCGQKRSEGRCYLLINKSPIWINRLLLVSRPSPSVPSLSGYPVAAGQLFLGVKQSVIRKHSSLKSSLSTTEIHYHDQ